VFALLKRITDFFVPTDSAQKGLLSRKGVLFGFGFAIFLFGTGVPAAASYQNHPEGKNIFIAAIVVDALSLVLFIIFGARWYVRGMARYRMEQEQEATDAAAKQEATAA
jgi:hypothetical protein